MPRLAENKKARFNYEITKTFEAGLELKGFEVKAVKLGKISLAGSYAVFQENELWLLNADIPPYQPNNTPEEYDQARSRKLLLTHEELHEIQSDMNAHRLTIVPLSVYTKKGLIKVELGLARGKKKTDKRSTIKKRETDRDIRRTLKQS